MGVEIERKFLVNKQEWGRVEKPVVISVKQGYLLSAPEKIVRIRVKGSGGFITIKGRSEGISRKEYEYSIPAEEAEELIDRFCDNVISKVRYKIMVSGKLWEVDEFHGDNEGLLMAEIELTSEDEEFVKPDWIDKEVSDDQRYYNANLAVNPFKNWGTNAL
ncbi:MAG: CYTH domain-containing protein [Chitinophagaceae bacterium]|nr:CYTH domain-containing protein [Chitinophagaceae bacterium]